ncbi:hypothetical protein [Alienimonas chondri]|uniref:hypothetical protein n=1 Tax=Alienimonas chondri TaxID=2681879 RepID=UPI0019D5F045|nr:hypothetical protein [Alienimonas chondri]
MTFASDAQQQVEQFLIGSRLREWREESVARIITALKDEPMRFGEGRQSDAFRFWQQDGLAITYHVDETAKRVTVLNVRLLK